MQVVRVFFTVLLVAFVVWLIADTIRLFIRKSKERKAKKQKQSEVNKEVIEQKEDNDKN